ncbi:MAG TPA: ABC transporter permease [Mycobacteriales bacterium]|nr:ABC transporter permease [Mycobacteriales bacterium]
MRLYVALALGGLPLGAMYALQALGIVVIYKTSRVFTFATGAVGMLAAYVASWLSITQHVPIVIAVLAATLTGVGVGIVMESLTIRPVRGSVNRTVVTLGWLIALQGLVGMLFGNTTGRPAAKVFSSDTLFTVDSLHLAYGVDQALVLVLAVGLTLGLAGFFRYSSLGTAMRAVADDPEAAGLLGMPVRRVTLTAWGLGCGLSALSGVLVTPLLSSLDTLTLVVFTIQALAAALIGRLRSLPLTVVGGLGLGMVQPVVRHALDPWSLSGTNELVALVVVLIALVARRRTGRSDTGSGGLVPATGVPTPAPHLLAAGLGTVLVLGLVLGLVGSTTFHIDLALVAIWSLAVLSIVLLTGVVGQVSVCQGVFMGVGGFGAAIAVDHGVPFLLALLLGGALAAAAAALVGLPALRLEPLELAIATLSLAFAADTFLYKWTPLVSDSRGRQIERPAFAGIDGTHQPAGQRAYFWLVLVLLVLACIAVASLRRGRTGAALTALRSSESATAAMGFSVVSAKLRGFAMAGFLAGLAGACYAGLNQIATGNAFDTTRSISLLAYAVVAGVGSIPGAVLGGVIVTLSTLSFGDSSEVASGFSASAISTVTGMVLIAVLRFAPDGLAGVSGRAIRWRPARAATPALAEVS